MINLFRVDKNRIEQCFAAHAHCSMMSKILNNIVKPESGVTMLNNIEQCGRQDIVQYNPVFINPEQVDHFLLCK
jgi:hypothetical protein